MGEIEMPSEEIVAAWHLQPCHDSSRLIMYWLIGLLWDVNVARDSVGCFCAAGIVPTYENKDVNGEKWAQLLGMPRW